MFKIMKKTPEKENWMLYLLCLQSFKFCDARFTTVTRNVWLHRRNFPRNSSNFFRTFILLSYRPFSWYGYFWNFSIRFFFSSEKKALVDILTARSSHRSCSVKKGVLRKFAKFTGKHMCQDLFFNKVASLRPATLLKKIF